MAASGQFRFARIIFMVFLVVLLGFLAVPSTARVAAKGNQTRGISNCKQVITWMKLYASDHDGRYPDTVGTAVASSNAAFRKLITEDTEDYDEIRKARLEKIFGCPASCFIPDGNIGSAPEYAEYLKPGENHWAMTRGQTDSTAGEIPLVFETPFEASWPPKWVTMEASSRRLREEQYQPRWPFRWATPPKTRTVRSKGGCWGGDKIIVGLNDSSVSLLPLKEAHGDIRQFASDGSSNNPFMWDFAPGEREMMRILDVEDVPGRKYAYLEPLSSLERPEIAWETGWATAGHFAIGFLLPALLYLLMAWITRHRLLRSGSVLIIGGVWFLLNGYHLVVEYPAHLANAAASGAPWQSVSWSNDLVYFLGWVEPLVACAAVGFYRRRRKGRVVSVGSPSPT